MLASIPSHPRAVFTALFVTFLWSTSWVVIKLGLKDMPALTFAGLRYSLASICLVPFLLHPARRLALGRLAARDWGLLVLLGLLYYSVTQGAQFVGLAHLPAVTVNLLLNFTSVVVAVLGLLLLNERPSGLQWLGVGLFLAGVVAYFSPFSIKVDNAFGITVVGAGVVANAFSSVLGRRLNRAGGLDPLGITAVSMFVGAAALLAAGIAVQGLPTLSAANWFQVAWLAVVNSALAFTLWNRSLQTLTAMESSIINGTMMVQIPILAVVFLGETLGPRELAGMVLAGAGAVAVQWKRQKGAARDAQGES